METFLIYILKASFCLLVFYVSFLIFFKRDTYFRIQRLYLITAIIASLLLAFNTISLREAEHIRNYVATNTIAATELIKGENVLKASTVNSSIQTLPPINIKEIFIWLYAAIVLLFLTKILMGFIKLAFLIITSREAFIGNIEVRITSKVEGSTAIFGFIFMHPSLQQNQDIHKILIHEKIHVSQRHSIDILVIELLTAVMWFNPVVWLLKRSLQQIHEYLADEGVLNSGINKLEYQMLLFNHIAEDKLLFSSGFQSSIKKRISMMTHTHKTKHPKLKLLAIVPLALTLTLGMSFVNSPSKDKLKNSISKSFQEDPAKKKKSTSNFKRNEINDKSKPNYVSEKTISQQDPPVTAVAPTRMNVLYLGVDNPVSIAVSGYKPSEINVNIDNGSILKNSDNSYTVRPSRPGMAQISVYTGDKLISKQDFRVKMVHDPVAKIGGKKSGQITKEELIKAGRLEADIEYFDFDISFKVTRFELSTTQKGFVIKESSNSNLLSDSQIEKINELSPGSKIYFENIKCAGPDGAERDLSPIMFEIK